uniref:NADH-ubiquinone oxidoreductase chain 5 n=1 Tax=Phrynoderma hexadactylum TaxID=2927596 RepID=E1NZ27_PHRHX|nr:NADH dehydrogenase subunit 5 [Phrynoderma hexadactylum]BAJ21254.1 NADH dehydrogenase subunit 5 [Phrynoderma hexadactylum]
MFIDPITGVPYPITTIVASMFTTLTILIILSPFLFNSSNLHKNAVFTVKAAFFLSLFPLLTFMLNGADNMAKTNTCFPWLNNYCSILSLWTTFDMYQIIFLPIALFVTGAILQFSSWYMKEDPKMNMFSAHLLVFLFAMILFTSAGDLILLYIGWEGVGMTSLLLIGWYSSRAEAAIAALMAVIYNRIGDIGFMAAFAWLIKFGGSSNLDFIFFNYHSTYLTMAFILAAASKSAQFLFHPWLIFAMEGPTPVSALLHSSTMVVAGVFLLIRLHPMFMHNPLALTICLCLGALTSAFTAWSAIKQNDMKKIIALSTASQLGLMMVAIGINLPNLAFFHLCTHAFFKAMLFLCSGIVIHNLADNQDIRHMGALLKCLPLTSSCMAIGSLALMGTPYLIAFYSKDAIIESVMNSYVNSTALILTLIATSFTALYSLRLVYTVLLHRLLTPHTTPSIFEEPETAKTPIIRLAIGSIIAGPLLFYTLFPSLPKEATLPESFKWMALVITTTSFFIALLVAWQRHWFIPPQENPTTEDDPTLIHQAMHRKVSDVALNTAWDITSFGIEFAFWKRMGLDALPSAQMRPIQHLQVSHKGLLQLYLATYFITLNEALIFLYIFS